MTVMTTFTPEDVSRVVRAVLARVRDTQGPGRSPAPMPPRTAPASAAPAPGFALPDKVVTAAILARVPAGTRLVSLRHDAVITPSARDLARETGLELVRPKKGTTVAAPARPFVVGTADWPGDAAARAATVVRSVPGATRIPATGLADVVAALALSVSRDGARGLLIAGRPHVAAALANRSPGVRAVTARDSAALLAAIGECAANVVVVHPRDFSSTSLERVAVALVTAATAVPDELAPASGCGCGGATPAACACTSHAH